MVTFLLFKHKRVFLEKWNQVFRTRNWSLLRWWHLSKARKISISVDMKFGRNYRHHFN